MDVPNRLAYRNLMRCPVCGEEMTRRIASALPPGQSPWQCQRDPTCGLVTPDPDAGTDRSSNPVLDGHQVTKSVASGSFVTAPDGRIGRVTGTTAGGRALVEFTTHPRPGGSETLEFDFEHLRTTEIPDGTRCFARNEEGTRWELASLLTRITNRPSGTSTVRRLSNTSKWTGDGDGRWTLQTSDIRIPARPDVLEPLSSIRHGLVDDPDLTTRRTRYLESLYEARRSTGGLEGLISANVQLHRHQIDVIQRVLTDPIQRYLLADEVGLGKTIEAGAIIRQYLLDDNDGKVLVLTPHGLQRQWEDELEAKFSISDFPTRVVVAPWSADLAAYAHTRFDGLLVVDEVHHLVGERSSDATATERYSHLRSLCHEASKVLLLSATPLLHNEEVFLGMLHLLDPAVFSLDSLEEFKASVESRRDFARRFQAFRPTSADFAVLDHAEAFRSAFPDDEELQVLLDRIIDGLDEGGDRDEISRDVALARAHIAETYRLHRRVLRSRRDSGSAGEFPVRGRVWGGSVEGSRSIDRDSVWRWFELWFYHLRLRLERGPLVSDLMTLTIGLIDRVDASPDVIRGYVECALGSSISFLTESERELLDQLADEWALPSTDQWVSELADEVGKLPKGSIVFCGFDDDARVLVDQLLKEGRTAGLIVADVSDRIATDATEQLRRGKSEYLVCGPTVEEGKNLQFATAVFHAQLSLDPNRVEQRIGRVDRYGEGHPVKSYVRPPGAQMQQVLVQLLRDGYGVFDTSIATLQHVLGGVTVELVERLINDGLNGLQEHIVHLRDRLVEERRSIVQLEQLESIDEESAATRERLELANKFDANAVELEGAIEGWLCGGRPRSPGLGLEKFLDPTRRGAVRFKESRNADVSAATHAAVDKHLSKHLIQQHQKSASSPNGQFNTYYRDKAVEWPDTRILRPGTPLFDAIANLSLTDALANTSAYWRRAPVDLMPVAQLLYGADVSSDGLNQYDSATVRRLVDGFLPPSTVKMNLTIEGEPPAQLEDRLTPWFRSRNDYPIGAEQLEALSSHLELDWDDFWDRIESLANDRLLATDLSQQRQVAVERASKYFSRRRQQLELRRVSEQQPRYVEDLARAAELEVDFEEAVIAAIDAVRLQPLSVCLVILGRDDPRELEYE